MSSDTLTIVKILYAPPHLGGSGRMGIQLARELAKRGHRIHIVSYPGTYLEGDDKKLMNIHPVRDVSYGSLKAKPFSMTLAGTVVGLSEKEQIDVIHAHYSMVHGEAANCARDSINRRRGIGWKSSKPVISIITNHGTDISVNGNVDILSPGIELMLSRANATTYVSKALQEEARRLFYLDDYGQVIYNFIGSKDFVPDDGSARREISQKHGIPESSYLFYHISNLMPVKNVGTLCDAFAKVVRYSPHPDCHLMIVGEGPELDTLKDKVSSYGLGRKVTFIGKIDEKDVPLYTKAGDALVLPSRKESFGLVNLEAMLVGNPVIASEIGGIPEVVEHGKSGFLFNPDKTDELTRYMIFLLKNPSLNREFGDHGRNVAMAEFNPSRVTSKYEGVYYSSLEGMRTEKSPILRASFSRPG